MNNTMSDDHDTIITLVTEMKNLTEAIKKMELSLDNLRTSFVPRDEFSNVKIAVMGISNDGGLLARVDNLEKTAERRKGSWSTVQVFFTVGIAIISAFLTYLSVRK